MGRFNDFFGSEVLSTFTGRRLRVKGYPRLSPKQRRILKERDEATRKFYKTRDPKDLPDLGPKE